MNIGSTLLRTYCLFLFTFSNTFEKTDNGFKIVFTDEFLNSIEDETYVIVQYSATLTSFAEISNLGNTLGNTLCPNKNTTYLTYGDNSTKSEPAETSTYTFGLWYYVKKKNS